MREDHGIHPPPLVHPKKSKKFNEYKCDHIDEQKKKKKL